MTFEEFFKKKKIDLPALAKAESGLFSEFERHFAQMGEKSFDHTKKYWFNKLRRQFPLPPEIKVEKLKIENPLAEQTIIESLEESTQKATAPKPGFMPRFKAESAPKPAEEKTEATTTPEQPTTTSPKSGFTPRFKAAAPPKAVEERAESPENVAQPEIKETAPAPTPKPAGFTPRFKAATPPKKVEEITEELSTEIPIAKKTEEPKSNTEAPAYKPRFKPGMLPKKPEE